MAHSGSGKAIAFAQVLLMLFLCACSSTKAAKTPLPADYKITVKTEDATPAAMVAHTRRRSDYDPIVRMFHESGVDVLMGGGSAHFLPKSTPGSRRGDDVDYVASQVRAFSASHGT